METHEDSLVKMQDFVVNTSTGSEHYDAEIQRIKDRLKMQSGATLEEKKGTKDNTEWENSIQKYVEKYRSPDPEKNKLIEWMNINEAIIVGNISYLQDKLSSWRIFRRRSEKKFEEYLADLVEFRDIKKQAFTAMISLCSAYDEEKASGRTRDKYILSQATDRVLHGLIDSMMKIKDKHVKIEGKRESKYAKTQPGIDVSEWYKM